MGLPQHSISPKPTRPQLSTVTSIPHTAHSYLAPFLMALAAVLAGAAFLVAATVFLMGENFFVVAFFFAGAAFFTALIYLPVFFIS
jgi:hypothetical protein